MFAFFLYIALNFKTIYLKTQIINYFMTEADSLFPEKKNRIPAKKPT